MRRPYVNWRRKFSYQVEQWTGKAVWRNCTHFLLYNAVRLSMIWSHPTRFWKVISVDLRSTQLIRTLGKLTYPQQLSHSLHATAWSRVIKQLAKICSNEKKTKLHY
jgi:hypothetical protein